MEAQPDGGATAGGEDARPTTLGLGMRAPTIARFCRVSGTGLTEASIMKEATLTIEAFDYTGTRQPQGGDAFFVAIRCNSQGTRARAKIVDSNDGSYSVTFKTPSAGKYTISISLLGEPLQGSPFTCVVSAPTAMAEKCVLQGDALVKATARKHETFRISFRDALGRVAHAEELDVYVERDASPRSRASAAAASIAAAAAAPAAAAEDDTKLSIALSDGGEPSQADTSADPAAGGSSSAEGGGGEGGAAAAGSSGSKRVGSHHEKVKASGNLPSLSLAAPLESIVVGAKPLIVRSDIATDSTRLGQLQPGRLLTVLKVERDETGGVRACVALDDKDDRDAIESWRALHPTFPRWKYEDDEIFASRLALSPPKQHSPRVALGWITIEKDGKGLVQKHSKLNAHQRQQHLQQWARRQAADRNEAADKADKSLKAGGGGGGVVAVRRGGGGHGRGRAEPGAVRRPKSIFLRELEADTAEGFGFAYGGVEPGRLRAHRLANDGLVEWHKVAYSIGLCGRYLLHVGLRQQSTPLPGSPFELEVSPGPAHALATRIDEANLPLRGCVVTAPTVVAAVATAGPGQGDDQQPPPVLKGSKKGDPAVVKAPLVPVAPAPTGNQVGCRLTLHAADKMGNLCSQGGAAVTCSCKDSSVEALCEDAGDGTYNLEWRAQKSGLYQVRVQIDGQDVIGSPTQMKLYSGTPDFTKTVLSGSGLTSAIAGKVATVAIQCVDASGNPTLPGSSMRFGIALLPASAGGDAWRTVEPHKFELVEKEHEDEIELRYVATEAGEIM